MVVPSKRSPQAPASREAAPRRQNDEAKGSSRDGLRQTIFFKTTMCDFFLQGRCTRSTGCTFAHHERELFHRPSLNKTKLCPLLSQGKICEDPGCSYAHRREEKRRCKLGGRNRMPHNGSGRGGLEPVYLVYKQQGFRTELAVVKKERHVPPPYTTEARIELLRLVETF